MAARLTHPHHLIHHAPRVRHHRHDMKAGDPFEGIIGKLELLRVTGMKLDMTPGVLAGLRNRMLEHVLGGVDPDDMNIRRVSIERDTGADAHLQNLLIGPKRQRFDNLMLMVYESPAKKGVIKMSKVGVDTALVRFSHQFIPRSFLTGASELSVCKIGPNINPPSSPGAQ